MGFQKIENNIIQLSYPRSGSTVVYQNLKEIFTNVIKAHSLDIINNCSRYNKNLSFTNVITIRDLRDSFASLLRITDNYKIVLSLKEPKFNQIPSFLCSVNLVLDFIKKPNTLVLKYENFWNDQSIILSEIEKYFKIELPLDFKEYLLEKTSIKTNSEIANKFKNFEQFDAETFIHGKHIYHPQPDFWKKFIPLQHHNYFTKLFFNELNQLGYVS